MVGGIAGGKAGVGRGSLGGSMVGGIAGGRAGVGRGSLGGSMVGGIGGGRAGVGQALHHAASARRRVHMPPCPICVSWAHTSMRHCAEAAALWPRQHAQALRPGHDHQRAAEQARVRAGRE
eukprot:196283-Chlamydomonas_euryale.AAC.1